jgi:hypothetical protein
MEALEVQMEHAEPELADVEAMNQALQVALRHKSLGGCPACSSTSQVRCWCISPW